MINEFRASLGILAALVALAGLLFGGFHWFAVRAWECVYWRITGR